VNVRGGAGLSATGAGDLGEDFSALSLFDEPTAGCLADSPGDTAGVSATVGAGDASVVGLGEAVGWLDAVFGDDEQPNWATIIVVNSRQQKINLFERCCI